MSKNLSGIPGTKPADLSSSLIGAGRQDLATPRLEGEPQKTETEDQGTGNELSVTSISHEVQRQMTLLRDGTSDARWRAAWALGKMADPRAIAALRDAVSDESRNVRSWAIWALGNTGVPSIPVLIELLDDRNPAISLDAKEALQQIGEPSIPALTEALRHPHENLRYWASKALGKIRSANAAPMLLEALKDTSIGVRANSAWALGEIHYRGAIPNLIISLNDRDESVRGAAARALGKMGEDSRVAVPALIEVLNDSDWLVRYVAAEALGEIKEQAAIAGLKQRLKREAESAVREKIAIALRKLGESRQV